MSWHLGRLCGFDLETTGTDVETDRIVTACVVPCGGNQPVWSTAWLADPGIEIPAQATAVHGITTARARAEGRPAIKVIGEIVAALTKAVINGIPIVAMNATFDLTLLDREARRHGITPLTDTVSKQLRVLDPRVLDKQYDPYRRGKRTLTDLCRHYGVALEGAHTADADALAACRVVWHIANQYPQATQATLTDLHSAQVRWARQQAESFASYLRRTPGKEHLATTVRGELPLLPAQGVNV